MPLTEIHLDPKSRIPLYLQIKEQIKDLILKDILPEGKRLLPTRELARILGVNRSTIVSAYNELLAEGFIESRVGRGTVVMKKKPAQESDYNYEPLNWSEFFAYFPKTNHYSLYRDSDSLFTQEDIISLGTGVPDPKYYPFNDFQKIISKLLKEKGRIMLQLSSVEGCYPLRETIADWFNFEGKSTSPGEVLITSGSNQGLYLLAETLLNPEDLVVVENPTSMNALRIFRAAGPKIIDIPVDETGMKVDILENLLSRQRVKMVYTVPTFQNPSGTVLSLSRRKKLLDLAYKYHVPIIEDDPYSKLYYERIPPLSLKALDKHNNVIYLGTFSKILFPGLRIGWIVAAKPVIKQLMPVKRLVDLHSNTLEQHAFYEYCNQGLLEKHLQKVRKIYAKKRDLTIAALKKCCSNLIDWNKPEGGYYLWCQLRGGLNSTDLLREAFYEKVEFIEGKIFSTKEDREEWLRLNFSYLDEDLIEEGINRFSKALCKLRKRHKIGSSKEVSSVKPII
ncbi:MAG: PLP-dependent aminotransferase family protein [Candidatus Aminicenantes bacterium]|nr:MAG: PLP-dependent aminotransferase family protein [Candidatus Aminicenantes bacterium]